MNKSWEEIAKSIKAIIEEKKISQTELGGKCGKKQGSISRILANKDVKLSTVIDICNALNVEFKWLL